MHRLFAQRARRGLVEPGARPGAAGERAVQHVGQHRQARHQIVALEHEAHSRPQPSQRRGLERAHVLAEQADVSRVGLDQAQAAAQQGGLAGAVGADQRDGLALADGKADVGEHLDVAAKTLREAPHFEVRGRGGDR